MIFFLDLPLRGRFIIIMDRWIQKTEQARVLGEVTE